MMRIIKRSLACAAISEALAFLLVLAGSRREYDVITATWFGKIGILLHWPGMKVEDHFGGVAATIGVPLVLWFVVWVFVWSVIEKIRDKRTPNHTPDGIRQPADGSPKPSV